MVAVISDVLGPDGRSYRRGRRPLVLPPPKFEPVWATVTRLHPHGSKLLKTIIELDRCWYQVRELPASVLSSRTVWRVIREENEEILGEPRTQDAAIALAREAIESTEGLFGGLIAVMPEQRDRTPGDGTLPNYLAAEIPVLNQAALPDPRTALDLWLDGPALGNVANSTVAVGHLRSRTRFGFLRDDDCATILPMLKSGEALHARPRFSGFKDDPMTPSFQVRVSA